MIIIQKHQLSLWQYYGDKPAAYIADSKSCKFKSRFRDKTDNTSTVIVKIVVQVKYSSNFWRTFEVLLINWN